MDNKLKRNQQCSTAVMAANKYCFIGRGTASRSRKLTNSIYLALMRSYLEYCIQFGTFQYKTHYGWSSRRPQRWWEGWSTQCTRKGWGSWFIWPGEDGNVIVDFNYSVRVVRGDGARLLVTCSQRTKRHILHWEEVLLGTNGKTNKLNKKINNLNKPVSQQGQCSMGFVRFLDLNTSKA